VDTLASQSSLDELAAAGLLTDREAAAAAVRLRSSRDWARAADALLLVLGAALLLAGVVFFFAWNWEGMSGALKLGVVELALIGCIAGITRPGLPGQVFLLAASVLVGVFLAVFGQVYQTGADAWTLFALWAALIVPWTVAARFGLCPLLFVVLVNVAVVLNGQQAWHARFEDVLLAMAAVNAVAVAAREVADHAGRWLRILLLAGVLGPLSVLVMWLVMDEVSYDTAWISGFIGYALALGGTFAWFRARDPGALVLAALSACVVALTFIGKGVLSDEPISWLFFGCICVAVFTAAAWLLRRSTGGSRALPVPTAESGACHARQDQGGGPTP